jgi:hypothetical protein
VVADVGGQQAAVREYDHRVVAVRASTTSTVDPPGGSASLPEMPQLNTTRYGGSTVM